MYTQQKKKKFKKQAWTRRESQKKKEEEEQKAAKKYLKNINNPEKLEKCKSNNFEISSYPGKSDKDLKKKKKDAEEEREP